ncbi:MAG: DUF3999 family protein [Acidobacteriota bacterium]
MKKLALLACCAAVCQPISAQSTRSPLVNTWTIAVDRAGPVLVPLDSRALAAGIASGVELRDPAGGVIEASVARAPAGTIDPALIALNETDTGWRLVFDLGPIPSTHDRLELISATLGHASGCVLEASDDLQRFRLLTRGDLFWIGQGSTLRHGSIEYAAASERFLQLRWPRAAGLPHFDNVHVHALDEDGHPPLEIELPLHDVTDRHWFELPSGTPPIEKLRWEFAPGTGPTTTLVLHGDNRRWTTLGFVKGTEFEFPQPRDGNSAVRLETRGSDQTNPPPLHVVGLTAMQWLLFEAKQPGAYTLRAGGNGPLLAASPRGVVQAGRLSDPRRSIDSALPRAPFEPRPIELPPRARRFALQLPAGTAGAVRVPFSESLLNAVGGDTHRLRLMTGDAVVPFLVETSVVPELAMIRRGAELLDTMLPSTGGMITQLELSGIDPGPAGLDISFSLGGERALRWTEHFTRRDPEGDAPTNYLVDFRPRADQRRLTISGLHESAVKHATLRLWREEDAWLFVKPAGEIDLVDGFTPDPGPFSELEPFRPTLTREAALASIQIEARTPASTDDRWSRPLLIAAEILVAAILLFVLWRAARRSTHNPRAGV